MEKAAAITLRVLGITVILAGLCFMSAGCRSVTGEEEPDAANDKRKKKMSEFNLDAVGAVDVGFLLTMNYEEAKKLSPQSMELPPYYKVAADEIVVLSQKSDGTPKKVRAKGHVFLQIDFREELSALGQEAIIGGSEVIIRGKPLLRRGRSVVEGLDDNTVFYILGLRLQAIGLHRLTNERGVTPTWGGAWKDGPNPLLPALSPNDIPKEMRASPLLPPVSKGDLPKSSR